MKWTKLELENSINLLKSGKTFDEIGIQLNRSAKSVKVKLNKLGYKFTDFSNVRFYNKIICLNCNNEFDGLFSSERKFCSQSCSATYLNLLRGKDNKCVNCDKKLLTKKYKYCSYYCNSEYNKNIIFNKIESGDITLNSRQYKKYLIDKYGDKCMECGWNKINPITNKVPIELEHIDGNSENNSLDNLKLLCPNCHSLTPTYRALNIGNGRHSRRIRYKEGKSY